MRSHELRNRDAISLDAERVCERGRRARLSVAGRTVEQEAVARAELPLGELFAELQLKDELVEQRLKVRVEQELRERDLAQRLQRAQGRSLQLFERLSVAVVRVASKPARRRWPASLVALADDLLDLGLDCG